MRKKPDDNGSDLHKQWGFSSLLLTLTATSFLMICWSICYHHDGDIMKFLNTALEAGVITLFCGVWPSPFDTTALSLITSFIAIELFLMKFAPGPRFEAPITASGHLPVYRANGAACYLITMTMLAYTIAFDDYYEYIGMVYDKVGEILSSLNVIALCFSVVLALKGTYAPSFIKCTNHSGDFLVDYLNGTEMHPRICGMDVKQFISCRFGLISWQVAITLFAFQQYVDKGWISSSMMVSVVLQSLYIYYHCVMLEISHLCSSEIQHDNAGYMFCWKAVVWMPMVNTLHTFFLVKHPVLLSPLLTALLLSLGLGLLWFSCPCHR
jgi:7-dehydrocholesterol reductase